MPIPRAWLSSKTHTKLLSQLGIRIVLSKIKPFWAMINELCACSKSMIKTHWTVVYLITRVALNCDICKFFGQWHTCHNLWNPFELWRIWYHWRFFEQLLTYHWTSFLPVLWYVINGIFTQLLFRCQEHEIDKMTLTTVIKDSIVTWSGSAIKKSSDDEA